MPGSAGAPWRAWYLGASEPWRLCLWSFSLKKPKPSKLCSVHLLRVCRILNLCSFSGGMVKDCLKHTLTFLNGLFFNGRLLMPIGGRGQACDSSEPFSYTSVGAVVTPRTVSGLLLKLDFHISCIDVSLTNTNHVLPLQRLFIVCTVQALDFYEATVSVVFSERINEWMGFNRNKVYETQIHSQIHCKK